MIPKLHKKGSSFKGAAMYLLHDKNAETSERVEWTETVNLATENPQAAWRVMAATAMEQNRLKREAGIAATGRKSRAHVLHLTLSWHPEEKDGLTKDEMIRAAMGAIRALGAQDHQALLVSHNDTQPHVHVLLNRVSPADGRMLSSSKEKLALSAWAEAYERERGEILCEERVLNNAARARGQFVRAKKEKPRHIFEIEQSLVDSPAGRRIQADQQKKDKALRKKTIAEERRHRVEWERLEAGFADRKGRIRDELKRGVAVARDKVAREFRGAWREMHRSQEQERRAFVAREKTIAGRASNALRQVDWRGLLLSGRRGQAIKEAFGLLSSSGVRAEDLRKRQERAVSGLARRERVAVANAISPIRVRAARKLEGMREEYLVARGDLALRQGMEAAATQAAWKARRQDRVRAWDALKRERPVTRARTPAEAQMDRMRSNRKQQLARELREALKKGDRDRGR